MTGVRAFPYTGEFRVTSNFGPRNASESYVSKQHWGLDMVGSRNKIIVSCCAGVVKIAQKNNGNGYGNYIWIANYDGSACLYAHLSQMWVKAGDKVAMKQQIGVEGSTGNSTGSHLHLGVSNNQDYGTTHANKSAHFINPAVWLGMDAYPKGQSFSGDGYTTGGTQVATATASGSNTASGTGLESGTTLVPSGEYYELKDMSGVLSDWLFGRRYRVFVDLGNNQALDVSELRCSFEVVKTAFREVNQSHLKIYNLSPEDENKLIKQGQRIIIEAGYTGEQYGVIFAGNVIQPIRSKENALDFVLTLVSMDAEIYANYGLVGVSLVAQQSMRDAVDAATQKATYRQELGNLTNFDITYPRGKVMFGMPSMFLDNIASSVNATYYSDDGKVNIISAKDTAKGEILEFGPESGLLGTPTQTEFGINLKVLLNPRVTTNVLFHVNNQKIEGYRYSPGNPVRGLDQEGIYRAVRVRHVGDTRGNDWYTEIDAISQAGLLPGMTSTQDIYAW